MMTLKIRMILLLLFSFTLLMTVNAQPKITEWLYQPADEQTVLITLKSFAAKSDLPIGDLMIQIGMSFLGIPYVSATLENGLQEKLVINLRQMDCTTFTETCLALARTVKSGKTDFKSFASELELIRYRKGVRNQYLSRLHYFSEWIHDNARKKIVSEEPNLAGEKVKKEIFFMSTHSDSYPVLKEHPELLPRLEEQEKSLSKEAFYYFPKTNPEKLLKNLSSGDIVGLTSAIEAPIDINHVGIIVEKDGKFYLLHASQTHKKVVLSDDPITDFIKPESKNSGIMIARPVF